MQNTMFVTALFNYTNSIGIHGRTGRMKHYLASLYNLTNLNHDIMVYCSKRDHEDIIRSQCKDKNNLYYNIFNLLDHKYHLYFDNKLKNDPPKHKDRCHEIMHSKVQWMYEQKDSDFIYWIDAGLSYNCLFPKKHRINHDYDCVLFNSNLVNNLNKNCDNKIIILVGDNLSPVPPPELCSSKTKTIKSSQRVIGGLFGGSKKSVQWLYEMYCIYFGRMIEHNLLCREEPILTSIYWDYPEKFVPYHFTTWYHEDTPNRVLKPNEISFYKIFEKLNRPN